MIVNSHPHHPHLKGMRPRKNKLAIVKKQFGKKLGKNWGKSRKKDRNNLEKYQKKVGAKSWGTRKKCK